MFPIKQWHLSFVLTEMQSLAEIVDACGNQYLEDSVHKIKSVSTDTSTHTHNMWHSTCNNVICSYIDDDDLIQHIVIIDIFCKVISSSFTCSLWEKNTLSRFPLYWTLSLISLTKTPEYFTCTKHVLHVHV